MKAVILAAGLGSRIRGVTGGRPKCLLSFDGRTMLDFQIEGLFDTGVRDLIIVVGHRSEDIVTHVARHHGGRLDHIHFVDNPHFASTNNMYSLWLARGLVQGACFISVNGDVICHPGVFWKAREARTDVSVLIDRDYREETTKVIIRDGRVRALSKSISREQYSGTFVNISTFSPAGARLLFSKAEGLFASGHLNGFYNDVLNIIAEEEDGVPFTDVEHLPWAEVDDESDLEFARSRVYPQIRALFTHAA